MVTRKSSKPVARATATRSSRTRSHTLAPAHLGEAASAAVLAVAVLGLAVFIAGVAMAVSGLTISNTFGSSPPPNVTELGTSQLLGGIALALLGILLTGSSLAVLAEVPHSRPVAAAFSGLAALLAVIGILVVQAQVRWDLVLGIALVVVAVIFGVAAVILVRPRR